MREDGLTIRGAQRLIALDRGASLRERGRLRLGAARIAPGEAALLFGGARPPGDVLDTKALGREQDDAGTLGMFERAGAVAGDRSQPFRVGRIEEHAYRLSHRPDSHGSSYA